MLKAAGQCTTCVGIRTWRTTVKRIVSLALCFLMEVTVTGVLDNSQCCRMVGV